MKKKIINESFYMVSMIVIISFVLLLLYKNANIYYPLISNYDNDVKYYEYVIKTTDEFGWFYENSRVAGGNGLLYNHSMGDFLQYILVKLIGCFTDNYDLIYNIVYFTSYFLCAFTMYAVARLMKLHSLISEVIALVFTFQPWHQLRMVHLLSSACYFMVPIGVLIGVWIAEENILGEKYWKLGKYSINKKYIFICLMTLLSSLSDIVFSAFNCYIIAIAILLSFFRRKRIKTLFENLIFLGIEIIGTLLMYIPVFLHWYREGINNVAPGYNRHPMQAQTYGLKIINLFIPREGHRISVLADFFEGYQNLFGANENQYTSMGIVICICLLLLLMEVFKIKDNGLKKNLAIMTIGIILISTTGGFGAIVAYIIPGIRTYDRMSIYISVFSLLYVGVLLNKKCANFNLKRYVIGILMAISVVIIAVFDSTVPYKTGEQDEIISYNDTIKEFVHEIEDTMPRGSKIYYAPYYCFPEGGSYEFLNGYLFSDKLVWSIGSMEGTENDLWQESLKGLPAEELCEQIVLEGYKGIYIDLIKLRQHLDYDYDEFIAGIAKTVNVEPIYSKDYSACYYDLRAWADEFQKKYSTTELDLKKVVTINYMEGFSFEKRDGDGKKFRWCNGTGYISINNRSSVKKRVNIKFYAGAYEYPTELIIMANENNKIFTLEQNSIITGFSFPVELSVGENIIKFSSPLEPKGLPKGIIEGNIYIKDLKATQ